MVEDPLNLAHESSRILANYILFLLNLYIAGYVASFDQLCLMNISGENKIFLPIFDVL